MSSSSPQKLLAGLRPSRTGLPRHMARASWRVPLLQHIAFRSVDPRSWSNSLRLNGRQAVRWAQHLAQSMPRVLGELAELVALLMPDRESLRG